jgi:23S rRNA A1618 N6-methylase RlmF
MDYIDKIIARQKKLAEKLEIARQHKRKAILKDVKEKTKILDFKVADFRRTLK